MHRRNVEREADRAEWHGSLCKRANCEWMNQVWNEIFKLILHPFAKTAKNEQFSRASSPCAVDSITRKRYFPDDAQNIMDSLYHVDAAPNHLEEIYCWFHSVYNVKSS